MPWSKKMNHPSCPTSNPIAVVKDEGKVVGCHASEKEADKQLTALYASEGRSRMSHVAELWTRVKEAFSPFVEEELESESGAIQRTIEDHRADEGEIGSLNTRTTVRRQKDGTYRWFSVSAVSAKNRVGEIDSRDMFDSFVRIAEATGKYPERDFMHLGRWGDHFRVGLCDFLARDGNTLVTSGLYYDTELARMEIAAREANPEEWGDSIEFILLDEIEWVEDTPVMQMGFLRFIATVPEKMAASHFTSGVVQEVDRMAMTEQQLQAFNSLFGDEEKAGEWLEKHVGDVEGAIEDAGMLTRSMEGEAETEIETEGAELELGVDEVELEIDVDQDVLDELVERTAELVLARFSSVQEALESQLATLSDSISALNGVTRQSMQDVERRLAELERDADTLVDEIARDMPRTRVHVSSGATFRPRANTHDDPAAQETPAQQAERVIADKWGNIEQFYGAE